MSAFLGKIHYWLYNKIQLHEKFINEVISLAKSKGYNIEMLIDESYSRYGYPVTGELENEIEHSNIHGWLQERIISVESRLAYVVTELLKSGIVKKEEITDVFYKNGAAKIKELEVNEGSPQDLFNLIFDYMLEGMPCDRVNEIIENSEAKIQWKTTRDIHKHYWDAVQGEIDNFYSFRDAWINGFLGASGMVYRYTRTDDGTNTIEKV